MSSATLFQSADCSLQLVDRNAEGEKILARKALSTTVIDRPPGREKPRKYGVNSELHFEIILKKSFACVPNWHAFNIHEIVPRDGFVIRLSRKHEAKVQFSRCLLYYEIFEKSSKIFEKFSGISKFSNHLNPAEIVRLSNYLKLALPSLYFSTRFLQKF